MTSPHSAVLGVPAEASDLAVVCATTDHVMAHFADIFVIVWRNHTTMIGAREGQQAIAKFGLTRPEGIGLVTIVEADAPLPPAPVREAVAELLRASSPHLRGSAVILEGNSIRAAAARGVATGMSLIARQTYPHKFFNDEDDALKWLAKLLAGGSAMRNAANIGRTIAVVRRRAAESSVSH